MRAATAFIRTTTETSGCGVIRGLRCPACLWACHRFSPPSMISIGAASSSEQMIRVHINKAIATLTAGNVRRGEPLALPVGDKDYKADAGKLDGATNKLSLLKINFPPFGGNSTSQKQPSSESSNFALAKTFTFGLGF